MSLLNLKQRPYGLLNTQPNYLLNSYPNIYTPQQNTALPSPVVTPPVVTEPLYWPSDGASVNAGGISDPEANDTMDVANMTAAEQEAAIGMLDAMSKGVSIVGLGPIGPAMAIGKSMLSLAHHLGLNANTPGSSSSPGSPGGTNPGPGTGGPAANSPAGGAQAAGGHAPGTGVPGSPGQGPGNGGASTGASPGTGVSVAPGTAPNFSEIGHEQDNSTGSPSGGTGTKVICTELYHQGHMPRHIWEADEEFAKTVDPDVRAGYLRWGLPVVRLMRRSALFTRFVRLFAEPWSEHMAYEMGALEKDNPFGRMLMKIGIPVCREIGVISRALSHGEEICRECRQ